MTRVIATLVALTALWAVPCGAAAPATDLQRMEGTWSLKYGEKDNKPLTPTQAKAMQIRITGPILSIMAEGKLINNATLVVDSTKKPKELRMESPEGTTSVLGIYKLESDELWLCWDNRPGKRPATFSGLNDAGSLIYMRLVRTAP